MLGSEEVVEPVELLAAGTVAEVVAPLPALTCPEAIFKFNPYNWAVCKTPTTIRRIKMPACNDGSFICGNLIEIVFSSTLIFRFLRLACG